MVLSGTDDCGFRYWIIGLIGKGFRPRQRAGNYRENPACDREDMAQKFLPIVTCRISSKFRQIMLISHGQYQADKGPGDGGHGDSATLPQTVSANRAPAGPNATRD